MKRFLLLALSLSAVMSFQTSAHKAWLLPSQTILAGPDPWITVDAAVSNDLFYFNHVPIRLNHLTIVGPDGNTVPAQNTATGKYRSVFDVELKQPGTYRLAVVNTGLFASWKENGQPKRWRGTLEEFQEKVPANADSLEVSQALGRIETYVTHGAPSTAAWAPSNQGIELVPVTHPNDLFVGEQATFRVLLDGQPAAGLKFEIVRGGTRYRNAQETLTLTTDAQGELKITWPEAGMYWLQTSARDDKAAAPAKQRRLSYVATLEVLPQ